jgi:hypothetical protein
MSSITTCADQACNHSAAQVLDVVMCAVVAVGAGAGFLLWELSTPFVHLRWLLHKSGRDKKQLYVTNGMVMMVVFFMCRPVWGTWLSYKVRLPAQCPAALWSLVTQKPPGQFLDRMVVCRCHTYLWRICSDVRLSLAVAVADVQPTDQMSRRSQQLPVCLRLHCGSPPNRCCTCAPCCVLCSAADLCAVLRGHRG